MAKENKKERARVFLGLQLEKELWHKRLPPWVIADRPEVVRIRPPIGKGHIDRFYFTNCTEGPNGADVGLVTATYYDDVPDPNPPSHALANIESVPHMSVRQGGHFEESHETWHVLITADAVIGGVTHNFTYEWNVDSGANSANPICSVVAGLELHTVRLDGDSLKDRVVPFGVAFGFGGSQFFPTSLTAEPPID